MTKKQYSEALYAATNWYVQLTSDEVTAEDHKSWQAWLNAAPEHKRAWQQVESVTSSFEGLDSKTSMAVLGRASTNKIKEPSSSSRRQALKSLSVLFAVGTTGWISYKEKPWNVILADYSTEIGEIKHATLEDGTKLTLNTNTKVRVDFSEQTRVVTLLEGEVHIKTGHEDSSHYRPFVVMTGHGSITALGTQFSTRVEADFSSVNVYESAIEVSPDKAPGKKTVINAGESLRFNANSLQQTMPLDLASNAWTKGFIIADKMPLGEFVKHLSRYHPGMLRCHPNIAKRQISGAFPINDIDAALTSISKTLSVRVETFTRYWIMLKPA